MSTALATVETGSYVALQDGGAIQEAMAANLGDGGFNESDLTRVTIPAGGSTTWTIPGLTGDEETKAIEGILVYQCVRGVLWPDDDPSEGTLPVLVSDDLKVGRLACDREDVPAEMWAVLQEHQLDGHDSLFNWENMPYTQWGSGKKGIGKQAREQRVLFILRQSDPLPIIVTIQPGSLKGWQKFIVQLTKAAVPYWQAVIRLLLETDTSKGGIKYSKVVPEFIGVLPREQADGLRQSYGETLAKLARRVPVE